jgi:glutaminyl-tRNA synthetase
MYDRLFTDATPTSHEDKDFLEFFNQDSLQKITAKVEPALPQAEPGTIYQFLRKGYFCLDPDSTEDQLVFNSTVNLRDTWSKQKKN